jgi:hypothetical protein
MTIGVEKEHPPVVDYPDRRSKSSPQVGGIHLLNLLEPWLIKHALVVIFGKSSLHRLWFRDIIKN